MEYAIVMAPAVAMRRKAWHQSEMSNQLLFGDSIKVLKKKSGGWLKVRSLLDQYEGWITNASLYFVNEEEARLYCPYVTTDAISRINLDGHLLHVPRGSSLPTFSVGAGLIGDVSYTLQAANLKRDEQPHDAKQVRALTGEWLNAPYLWGGKTIFGVDCSGFVQTVYKMMGVDLPRDAWQQAQEGETVKKLKEARCGDLAFFDDKDEIVHVGILLGDGNIIHSSGRVRIDTIDKRGIVNLETGKRTHDLRVIKRCC